MLDKKNIIHRYADFTEGQPDGPNRWIFQITTRKNEYIRFWSDSLSCLIYGTYKNPKYDAHGTSNSIKTEHHSLRASKLKPGIYLEECTGGRPFIEKIDIIINNKTIPTDHMNYCGSLFSKLYSTYISPKDEKSKYLILSEKDVHNPGTGGTGNADDPPPPLPRSKPLERGLKYFHYGSDYNARKKQRLPFCLRGYFLFNDNRYTDKNNLKNFLPPGTKIEIRIQLYSNFEQHVNREKLNPSAYYDTTMALTNDAKKIKDLKLYLDQMILDYEIIEISDNARSDFEHKMNRRGIITYNWDIPFCQWQNMGTSMYSSENTFMIPIKAKYLFVAWQPSCALFPNAKQERNINTWARFPKNCEKIIVQYNGENNLISKKELTNFGVAGVDTDISMYIFYDYILKYFSFKGSFEKLFSRDTGDQSLVQVIPLYIEPFSSASQPGSLRVSTYFDNRGNTSNNEIICISVHSIGKVELSKDKGWHYTTF